MSADSEMGKRQTERMVLDQLLDFFPLITGRAVTEDWDGEASQVEGSPDFIIGLDGQAFGIELTEIRGIDDPRDYVEEAYRLGSQKGDSYARRGIFRFAIALIMHSNEPPLFDIRNAIAAATFQEDFEALGFNEIWAIDFGDAYYSPGDPRRPADMFCFKPRERFGFHRIGGDRKPYVGSHTDESTTRPPRVRNVRPAISTRLCSLRSTIRPRPRRSTAFPSGATRIAWLWTRHGLRRCGRAASPWNNDSKCISVAQIALWLRFLNV